MKFLNNLSRRERVVLTIALLIVVVALIDRLVALPVRRKIAELDARIRQQDAEYAAYRVTVARGPVAKAGLNALSSFVERSGSDEKEMSLIQSEIEVLASQSEITRIEYKAREAETGSYFKTFRLEVEMSGTVDQLAQFLYALNSSPAALRVEQFTLRPTSPSSPFVSAIVLVNRVAASQVMTGALE